MAVASTFIPGLNSQNPHFIPGYTGHCPLLRFSMGQTYGQVTGKLLRGPPGLAWPPAHRTLLPPIQPPRSPEVPKGSLPARCGHASLSSSMIPGYTGFVPRAQFIFAKNCSQVWGEALNESTQSRGVKGSKNLVQEAKGEKDMEKNQEPKLGLELEKKPTLEEAEHVRPRRLVGGECRWWRLLPIPWMTQILRSSSCQALQEFGQKYSLGGTQKDPKHLPPLLRTYEQNLGLLPNYGGYVPGYKFQFGHTFGHLTRDTLGLSTIQKQLLA
ncbi:protein FAM166B isoform X2 [Otolemur garnettii]|uniref:protein FAM166B isoform X2 n=1 Tax=Otolemur garnettii TaxID=30611 RepID=UPI0006442DA0|nr:protein FAM166B isoform X2 [Otolemur garnettii]